MNIYFYIEEKILELIGKSIPGVVVEPARNSKHGDISTNAPIILSNIQKKPLQNIAHYLSEHISKLSEVKKVELAGAGFLNITIKEKIWHNTVKQINREGLSYGSLEIGHGKTIHIESVSANPTGPLHIGHARAAIFFEVLGKLLEKVGYKVIREYYINDAGVQINALIESVFLRYLELLGNPLSQDIQYPGEYLKDIAHDLLNLYGKSLALPNDRNLIRDFTIKKIMSSIKADLALLSIQHDLFISEESISNKIEAALEILQKKDLIYCGTLEDPKGKKRDDWQAHRHMLFKSTRFGDDADRSLTKSDGSWTYFAADIAYHLDKIQRGFDNMILGLGLDHAGYVKRLTGAVKALTAQDITIDVKLLNIVHLFENGTAIKMSKRSGKFLTVRDLIKDVGADVVKYMMITRRHDVVLDLDIDQVKEQSKNNPVFYVQYAHARACSVLRQVGNIEKEDVTLLTSEIELAIIKILAKWPRIAQSAAKSCEPHRITSYLQEISESFHALWNYGSKEKSFRFINQDNKPLTGARISLVKAVKHTIASGLDTLNIQAKEFM